MLKIKKNKNTLGGVDVGSPIIRQALIYSITDGIFASIMCALAETFSIPAAVRLKAPPLTIALLSSAPILIGSLGQYFLPLFLDKNKTRKYYVVPGVRIQATFLIITALSGWFPSCVNLWLYIISFILYGATGNLFTAIWTSWIRDCIPQDVRGRHFAWRNRIISITQLLCAVIVGIISRKYDSQNAPWILFAFIFFSASLFRFGSAFFLSKQYEPQPSNLPDKIDVINFKPSKLLLKFCIAIAMLQGSTAITSPFFNVWFLRDLKFDYLTFTISTSCTILGTILLVPLWGRLIDHIGTSQVLRLTGLLCAVVPLPYLINWHPFSIWLFNFYSGIAWGGFNIASLNYLLYISEREKSNHCIAFYSAIVSIIVFLFSVLGGFLATRIPTFFTYQLQSLFFISSLLRLATVFVFFKMFRQEEIKVLSNTIELVNEPTGYKIGMELIKQLFRLKKKED
jgi:MFS family permease